MVLKTNAKITICAMASLIILLFIIVFLEAGLEAVGEFIFNDYIRYLFLMIITSLFFGFLASRTLQKGIAKSIFVLGVSLGFLYFCRSIREVSEATTLARFFWYLYYPSWFGMALGFLGIVYFSETSTEEREFPIWWKSLACVSAVLALIVLTNDYHQLMFKFLPDFENYDAVYHEGILGLPIKAILLIEFAVGNLWLTYKAMRSSFYRMKIFLPGIVLSIIYVYVICYTFRWFNMHNTEVATVTGLGTMVYLTACIYSKLIPLNVKYERAFQNSQLGIQILNKKGEVCYESRDARGNKDNYIIHNLSIKNGKVIWQEDISDLILLKKSLNEQNFALARTEKLLLRQEKVQGEALDLKLKNSIFDDVEGIIESNRERLEESLELVNSNREYAIKLLKLVTGFLKKRCMLFVASKADGNIDALELRMSMQESMLFAREAGLYNSFSFNYNDDRIDGLTAGAAYDCMEYLLWSGIKSGSEGIMFKIDCGSDYMRMNCMVASGEIWLKTGYDYLVTKVGPNSLRYRETEDTICISLHLGRRAEPC